MYFELDNLREHSLEILRQRQEMASKGYVRYETVERSQAYQDALAAVLDHEARGEDEP